MNNQYITGLSQITESNKNKLMEAIKGADLVIDISSPLIPTGGSKLACVRAAIYIYIAYVLGP